MNTIHVNLINNKYKKIIFDLLLQLELHSEESFVHSIDVAQKSILLARSFGVSGSDLENLYTAALLHDIGKLYVNEKILHKPNATNYERELIRLGHIEGTREILEKYFDEDIVKLASHHHERLNNSGYPEHLNAKKLSLLDRILQVADVTSALAMNRSYQQASSPEKIIEILDNLVSRGELDKKCVKEMQKLFLFPMQEQSSSQPESE